MIPERYYHHQEQMEAMRAEFKEVWTDVHKYMQNFVSYPKTTIGKQVVEVACWEVFKKARNYKPFK